MNKLATLIANGNITVEELASAKELIERAELVTRGIKACQKTLRFPFGKSSIRCYSYRDSYKGYEAWGDCTIDGNFTCYCNWGGTHVIGSCNLMSFTEVFMAFENSELEEFANNLKRFLRQQIDKAE